MEAADGCEFIGHGVTVFKDDLGGEVLLVARDLENLEDGVVLALLEDRGFGEPAVLEAAAVGGQAGRRAKTRGESEDAPRVCCFDRTR